MVPGVVDAGEDTCAGDDGEVWSCVVNNMEEVILCLIYLCFDKLFALIFLYWFNMGVWCFYIFVWVNLLVILIFITDIDIFVRIRNLKYVHTDCK